VAIIKHSNPCGAAYSASIEEAWHKALACDPQSASGGIISCSAVVDEGVANAMRDHFIEVLVAPAFSEAALEILREKKNRILLRCRDDSWGLSPGAPVLRGVPGGLLAQSPDDEPDAAESFKVVTEREPSQEEMNAMLFGWSVVRYVKSNAIVYSGPDRLLGVGAGQMSRVDSARIAALKASQAGLDLTGSAVASDAFFPFADGLLATAEAGATAVIQPGGSVRDEEVIAAANEKGLAMVFTGLRHFRH
jgi:phosphoribosylaminoimidazolecarboxamide formyltransferase/IMP cyclohydrolase